MSRPILFLDIDGVLNNHYLDDEAESCGSKRECVIAFNGILRKTDCDIVLSSAWRYLVLGGEMTCKGFASMLRTHGVAKSIAERIIGITRRDEDVDDDTERAKQVMDWLDLNPAVKRFVIVDDKDFGFTDHGLPFVQTDGKVGLTYDDAERLIELLGRRAK